MNTPDALAFLQQHQPLPPDEVLAKQPELIDMYSDVIRHFAAHPDARCAPLLLNSFGGRNGLGVYQLVEDALFPLGNEVVVPLLARNVAKGDALPPCVLYWNVEICLGFTDEALREPLRHVLTNADADTRMAAILALAAFNDSESRKILLEHSLEEKDEDALALLKESLEEMDA